MRFVPTYSSRGLLCWDPAASLGPPSTQLRSSQSASSTSYPAAQTLLFPAAAAEHRHLIAIALKVSPSTTAPGHWLGRSWRCHGLKRRAKIGSMSMSGRHGSSTSCAGARPLGAGGAPGEELHEGQERIICVAVVSGRELSGAEEEEENFANHENRKSTAPISHRHWTAPVFVPAFLLSALPAGLTRLHTIQWACP